MQVSKLHEFLMVLKEFHDRIKEKTIMKENYDEHSTTKKPWG